MNEETEVESIKKKLYLVIGVIPKDISSVALHIQANLEFETNKRIVRISEQEMIYDYAEKMGYHPLCLKEWLEPIKNKIIIRLLERTEAAILDNHVSCSIVDGSFALDIDVRKAYIEILEEQGYEVVVVPVASTMMSIISYGWSSGVNLKSLYLLWKKYNQQFSRTYEPLVDMPSAIVVDENVVEPILIEIIQSLSDKNRIIVIAKNQGNKYPFDTNHVMVGDDKIDVFWTKLAYHFNVKLIVDNDPNSVHRWHQIDVPVISLTSQYALEKNL